MFCSLTKSQFEMWKAHKNQCRTLISERTYFIANCKTDSAALVLLKWHIKLISAMFWGYREYSKVNDLKLCYTVKQTNKKQTTNCKMHNLLGLFLSGNRSHCRSCLGKYLWPIPGISEITDINCWQNPLCLLA